MASRRCRCFGPVWTGILLQRLNRGAALGRGRAGIGSDAEEVSATSVVLLPCTPASVAVARRRLADDLCAAGVRGQVIGDGKLVVSELLSNAIRHAWPLPGEKVQVTWMMDRGQ